MTPGNICPIWNAKCDIKLVCDTMCFTMRDTMCDIDNPRQNLQEECFVDLNEPQRTFQSTVVNRWLLLRLVFGSKHVEQLVGNIGRLGSKQAGGHWGGG